MADDIDWTRLARYFAGECAPDEAEEMRRWIDSDPARRRTVEELRAAWDAAAAPITTWDTPAAWHRLAARLHSRERGTGLALVRDDHSGEVRRRSRSRLLRRAAIAAAIVLAAAGGLRWSGLTRGERGDRQAEVPLRVVRVPPGQRAQFQLPEGTRILLGPGTVLRYDTTEFGGSTRELQLDGQAHFVVVHDTRRPFLVRTARTLTEDLGTEFAITDYADDPTSEVVVASGTVVVRSVLAEPTRPASVLHGGDLVRLDPTGGATVRRGVDLRDRLAWTEGRLVFSDTPVAEVLTRLNRWYGADVRLGDPSLAGLRYTAAYGAASEATVVQELATAIGATVRRRGDSVILVPLSERSREN